MNLSTTYRCRNQHRQLKNGRREPLWTDFAAEVAGAAKTIYLTGHSRLSKWITFGLVLIVAASTFAQGTTDTLALTGDPLPNGTGTYSDINPFVRLNDAGQVAFSTNISDSIDVAIVLAESTNATQIARTGDSVPGGNGSVDVFGLSLGGLNNQGQVVFKADLAGTSGGTLDDEVIYVGNGFQLTEIAREGAVLPPTSPPLFDDPAYVSLAMPTNASIINDDGRVVFKTTVSELGAFDDTFFLVSDPTSGVYTIAVQEADTAPFGSGLLGIYGSFDVFGLFNQPTASLNNSGETAFHSETRFPAGHGVFWSPGLSSSDILSAGRTGQDDFPGNPGTMDLVPTTGGFAGDPSTIDMNENGEIVYRARLNELTGPDDYAIFRFSPDEAIQTSGNGLTTIARRGDVIPDGTASLGVPSNVEIQINSQGEVAFTSQMISAEFGLFDLGIFKSDGLSTTLIARFGQAIPGGLPLKFNNFFHTSINDSGQVAFTAALVDANGDFAGKGMFIYDGVEIVNVAVPGQELAGSAITNVNYQEVDGINETGQVAFGAQLADGRDGVFLYTLDEFLLGDVNGDGEVDLLDVAPFIDAISTGAYIPEADINQDGVVNLLDVSLFVELLNSN